LRRTWRGYRVSAFDDTEVHRASRHIWGIFRPAWNEDKDRPRMLDTERLIRHRGEIQRFLSGWLGIAEKTEGDAA
jgi:hypothetical protein